MKRPGKALFLDRDGVINVEKNYVFRVADFEFVEGIFDLCAAAQKLGFLLIVITNQAGIGRGLYTETDFQHLTRWMLQQFQARGIVVERVYHCPHHPTAGIGTYRRESFDRKPNPGMILQAARDFGLDLAQCALIGDKDSDIEAGRTAGIDRLFKVIHDAPAECVTASGDLRAARVWLLAQDGRNAAEPSVDSTP